MDENHTVLDFLYLVEVGVRAFRSNLNPDEVWIKKRLEWVREDMQDAIKKINEYLGE